MIFLFLIGLSVGSFIGVVVDRSYLNKNWLTGRSFCDYCKHSLSPFDLIPLLSFIILKGKCKYCHHQLSLFYPLTELTTAIVFILTYLLLPEYSVISFIYYFFISIVLLIVLFADLKYTIIPFVAVLPATVVVYLFYFLHGVLPLSPLLSGIGACSFFLLLFFITRGKGMGFGDVVYVFFMGSLLSYPRIITGLYIAFVLGAFAGVVFIILKHKKLKGTAIPFGPFLVLGTYIAWFLPSDILFKLFLLHA